ncbi:MAG: patatin-like phospholipase family protein [Bacteroidaceae bacterium]|nr:patatin-like phospholipase family protein [Bacteroidaceae bacterium]
MKDVALVLSSGSARGLAHIGVIEELEARGYRITSVAGCSMGALVGGIYAAGKLKEYREWMKGINRRQMLELVDFSLSLNHLVKGERIIEAIMKIVPDIDIENLPIPYCAIATDWAAGEEIVFRKGSLFQAIRASISLPSFFNPVRRDNMILIDGGITNPLPLNRVERKEGDLLVGADVSGYVHEERNELQQKQKSSRPRKGGRRFSRLSQIIIDKLTPENLDINYFTLLSRSSSIMLRQNACLMTELTSPDILIDIELKDIDSFDYDKSEKIIAVGREYARKALERYDNANNGGQT